MEVLHSWFLIYSYQIYSKQSHILHQILKENTCSIIDFTIKTRLININSLNCVFYLYMTYILVGVYLKYWKYNSIIMVLLKMVRYIWPLQLSLMTFTYFYFQYWQVIYSLSFSWYFYIFILWHQNYQKSILVINFRSWDYLFLFIEYLNIFILSNDIESIIHKLG